MGAAVAWALALCLCGCETTPPPAPPRPIQLQWSERQTLYVQTCALARRAAAEGRLHEALWRWRIAEALALDPALAVAEEQRVTAEILQKARAFDAEAQDSLRRHDLLAARAAFRSAIALDPNDQAARSYLRDDEIVAILEQVEMQGGDAPRRSRPRPSATGQRSRPASPP
jgi:hypothetical protein